MAVPAGRREHCVPRIYVEYARMSQLGNDLASTSAKIDVISADLKSTIRQLDWDVKFQSNINSSANQIALKLDRYTQVLKKYKQFIESAQLSYRELDTERFDSNLVNVSSLIEPENAEKDLIFEWFRNIIIDKPYIIPGLLPIISPITKLLFLDSGVIYSQTNGGTSSGTSTNAEWLGAKYADGHPGVTAWIGKASAETKNDWSSASVNAYLGKAEAEAKAKAGFMQYKDKSEYSDGEWSEKEKLAFLFAEASAGASVAAVAADAKGSIGSDMLGLDGKAEGTLGSAKAEAKGAFSVGEDGVNAYVKGEAMVAAAEGKVSGSVNILGLEIKGTLGGYAGAAGVEGKIGVEDNKFVIKGGVAALIGGSVGLEIGFNDEGWSNFVDFITFWD